MEYRRKGTVILSLYDADEHLIQTPVDFNYREYDDYSIKIDDIDKPLDLEWSLDEFMEKVSADFEYYTIEW